MVTATAAVASNGAPAAAPQERSNITSAYQQWSNRPAEERFRSLGDMQIALQERKQRSAETGLLPITDMQVLPIAEQGLAISNKQGAALLNNYSLGQLAQGIGAPAGYLRTLPAHLAAACINEGLPRYPERERSLLVTESEQGNICRAITSDQYSRYWDCDVVTDLLNTLDADGWRVPPARPYPDCPPEDIWIATEQDVLPGVQHSLSVRVGDRCGPAGLYGSDRDMFALLVNQERSIKTPSGNMYRALILRNSEVGASSYNVECILYSQVCGNHILWSAASIANIRLVHRGSADSTRLNGRAFLAGTIAAAEQASCSQEQQQIAAAAEQKLDIKAAQLATGLPKGTIQAAEIMQEQFPGDHGDRAGTTWGWVQGLTRASQQSKYMADRTAIDLAAAKLLRKVDAG